MMVLKNPNQSGFSFLEVTLAVAIFALMVTSLLTLQARLLERAVGVYDTWNGMILLKNYLVEADRKQLFDKQDKQEKTVELGLVRLAYQLKKIPEGSPLAKLQDIRGLQADARWRSALGFDWTEQLASFVLVSQKQEQA
jgi:hypothetical protein